ncbi:hypothetical protein ACSFCM_17905 [Enterococcus gilvus]
MRAYRKQKSVKIDNMQNVIFVYVRNLFVEELILADRKDSLPHVNLSNWVDKQE